MERKYVCVCLRERGREKESKREEMGVCVYVCLRERKKGRKKV